MLTCAPIYFIFEESYSLIYKDNVFLTFFNIFPAKSITFEMKLSGMEKRRTISPISKAKLSLAAQLKRKKVRDENSLFITEGEKCVKELLGYFKCRSIMAEETWFDANPGISAPEMFSVKSSEMKKIASFATPSPVAAIFEAERNIAIPDKVGPYELMLDGIQDPGNLGTIIRTADWFGFKRIFASKDTADVFNPKTIQSTMGALGRVDVIYCNLVDMIHKFPMMEVYGLLLDGKNIYHENTDRNGFIVMGNEGKGIREELRRMITRRLLIPSYPEGVSTSESLNVAVATAITLSEIRRREL